MRKLLLFLMLLSSVAFGQLHKSPEGPNRWVIWMPLTQTQIDALSPVEGMAVFNSTDATWQVYQGAAWVNLLSVAGGDITAVVAGTDLTGGATSGSATVSLNDTLTQAFVFTGATKQDVADTTELTALSAGVAGFQVRLRELASGAGVGGGLFILGDSTFQEGVVAFNSAITGKQWVRAEWLKNPGTFNVRWTGAAGDGVTDVTAAIQVAVAAAQENGGGVIYMPTGVYGITAPSIRIDSSNITLMGDGNKTVLSLLSSTDSSSETAIYVNRDNWYAHQDTLFRPSNIVLKDFRIEANGLNVRGNGGNSDGALAVLYSDNVLVQNVYIHRARDVAFNILGNRWYTVRNCTADSIVYNQAKNGFNFTGSQVQHIETDYGIVEGNTAMHVGDDGFFLAQNKTQKINFVNNIAIDCDWGAIIEAGSGSAIANDVLFVGNQADSCKVGFGVFLASSSNPQPASEYITLTGNIVDGKGRTGRVSVWGDCPGVDCDSSFYAPIGIVMQEYAVSAVGNIVHGVNTGIIAGDYDNSNRDVTGNLVISANQIYLMPNATGNAIHLKKWQYNATQFLQSIIISDNILEGGTGTDTLSRGIYLNGDVRNVAVANNIISGFGGSGIFLHDQNNVSDITVDHNTIKDNGNAGGILTENTAGIFVDDGCDRITIRDNRIYDSRTSKTQSYGIATGTVTNLWITGNDLVGNLTGAISEPVTTVSWKSMNLTNDLEGPAYPIISQLSDVAIVRGAEIIQNGFFDTDTLWTKINPATFTIAAGVAHFDSTQDSVGTIIQYFSPGLDTSRIYRLSFVVSNAAVAASIQVQDSFVTGHEQILQRDFVNGTHSQEIRFSASTSINISAWPSGSSFDLDSVSLTFAEPNNKDLLVYDVSTKTWINQNTITLDSAYLRTATLSGTIVADSIYARAYGNLPASSGAPISDVAYSAAWNGDADSAASRNAIYDKIELLGAGGEVNTASNLGGGLANWISKSSVDLRFVSFDSSDFNLADSLIGIDSARWATQYDLTLVSGTGTDSALVAGNGLGRSTSTNEITLFNQLNSAGGLQFGTDSIGIKLDTDALGLAVAGLYADTSVLATQYDLSQVSGTGTDTILVAGDAVHRTTSTNTITIDAVPDFDGGIETVDDSLNIKLNTNALGLGAAGLYVDTAVVATQYDLSQVSGTGTDTITVAGDGLGRTTSTNTVTLLTQLDATGGLETVDDSINVKIHYGLVASASGLAVDSSLFATFYDNFLKMDKTGFNDSLNASTFPIDTTGLSALTTPVLSFSATNDTLVVIEDGSGTGTDSVITAGNGLGRSTATNNVTLFNQLNFDGGLQFDTDSIGIKLNTNALGLAAAGLYADTSVLATQYDLSQVSGTGTDTILVAGDGVHRTTSTNTITVDAVPDFDGGIETIDDSLNIKLNTNALGLGAAGLYVDTSVVATQYDLTLISGTGTDSVFIAGNGLGRSTATNQITAFAQLNATGGLQFGTDSIGVKLKGSTLALDGDGLAVDTTLVTGTSYKMGLKLTASDTSSFANQFALKAATATTITAGNGLQGGGSLAANRTIDASPGYAGGLQVSSDSLAIKLVTNALGVGATGLYADTSVLATQYDLTQVSGTGTDTVITAGNGLGRSTATNNVTLFAQLNVLGGLKFTNDSLGTNPYGATLLSDVNGLYVDTTLVTGTSYKMGLKMAKATRRELAKVAVLDSVSTFDTLMIGYQATTMTIDTVAFFSLGTTSLNIKIDMVDSLGQTAGGTSILNSTAITITARQLAPTSSTWTGGKLLRLVLPTVTTEPKTFSVHIIGHTP